MLPKHEKEGIRIFLFCLLYCLGRTFLYKRFFILKYRKFIICWYLMGRFIVCCILTHHTQFFTVNYALLSKVYKLGKNTFKGLCHG